MQGSAHQLLQHPVPWKAMPNLHQHLQQLQMQVWGHNLLLLLMLHSAAVALPLSAPAQTTQKSPQTSLKQPRAAA